MHRQQIRSRPFVLEGPRRLRYAEPTLLSSASRLTWASPSRSRCCWGESPAARLNMHDPSPRRWACVWSLSDAALFSFRFGVNCHSTRTLPWLRLAAGACFPRSISWGAPSLHLSGYSQRAVTGEPHQGTISSLATLVIQASHRCLEDRMEMLERICTGCEHRLMGWHVLAWNAIASQGAAGRTESAVKVTIRHGRQKCR